MKLRFALTLLVFVLVLWVLGCFNSSSREDDHDFENISQSQTTRITRTLVATR